MDVIQPAHHNFGGLNPIHSESEDYPLFLAQLQQSRDHSNGLSTNPALPFEDSPIHPAPASRRTESGKLVFSNTLKARGSPAQRRALRNFRSVSGPNLPMDHPFLQYAQSHGDAHVSDAQDEEFNHFLLAHQQASGFDGLQHMSSQHLQSDSMSNDFWSHFVIDPAHSLNAPSLESPIQSPPLRSSLSRVNMSALDDPAAEAAAMGALVNDQPRGSFSLDNNTHAFEDRVRSQSQQGVLQADRHIQPEHEAQYFSQVKQFEQPTPVQHAEESRIRSLLGASPDNAYQSVPDPSQSPNSVAESSDRMTEFSMINQDSRRPSMTADLTQNISNIDLQPSHSVEIPDDAQRPAFKMPPRPGNIAERRNQAAPTALDMKVSRPSILYRAASSSAIGQQPSGRYPLSPHGHPQGSLRRNKSSNVVLNGRVQKSNNNSNRNSPMVSSFNESFVLKANQAAPHPPTPQVGNIQHSLMPPSPHHMVAENQLDMAPATASTSTFTPAMHSSGVPGHSFQNTPVTTPYAFAYPPPVGSSHWQAAPDVPQSAPAHLVSFPPNPLSPMHGGPSMPSTPAGFHFPPHMHHQPQLFPGHVIQHGMPIVPSQPGIPENMAMMAHPMPEMMHPGFHDQPYPPSHPDPYFEHTLWAAHGMHYPPAYQKPMEVKFDAGCDKLNQEVAEGKATILPVEQKSEYNFQNLFSLDMKKQLEKGE